MMDVQTNTAPEPVVLIIADISGYTRYMTANAKTLAHSQTLITELVKSILHEVSLPLEVAKLEGDAVFLFGRKGADPASRAKQKQVIGQKLIAFFEVFGKRVGELSYATTCNCTACANIGNLRLKLIVHSGEALFHRILDFQELAGVDVIVVHRLLKNSVAADQYLLMTETAQQDMELPAPARLVKSSETYDDIGRIDTLVYYPQSSGPPVAETPAVRPAFGARFRKGWTLFLKLWFDPLRSATGGGQPGFQHVTSGATRAGRMGFALLTLLLTPIYLPVGALFVAWRARKQPDEIQHQAHDHMHLPDGSCCKKD
jgi:hypothetical protein